jgi:hypothetical protein
MPRMLCTPTRRLSGCCWNSTELANYAAAALATAKGRIALTRTRGWLH